MKIFLDANILVTVINREYPLFSLASRIISLEDERGFTIHTSAICLAIAFYFAEIEVLNCEQFFNRYFSG